MASVSLVTRMVSLAAPLGRRGLVSFKPAREPLSTAEMLIGFGTLSATILVPAAWFLAHIESYKKRE